MLCPSQMKFTTCGHQSLIMVRGTTLLHSNRSVSLALIISLVKEQVFEIFWRPPTLAVRGRGTPNLTMKFVV